jgi:hypothetical protein
VNIDDDLHTVDADDPFVPPENKVVIPAPPAGVWDAFVGALEYGTVEVTNSAVELASSAKAKAHDEGLPDEFNEYLAWSVNPVGQMVEKAVKGFVDTLIVEVPIVYGNSRVGGYSRLDSAGNAVGTALATIVGVRGISDAFSEHDAVDAHRQSLGERIFDGVFGAISLVGTAVGLGGAAKSLSSGGAKVNPVKPRAGDPATAAPNRTVIGKTQDLDNLAPGENTLLKHLPDQGTPRANWRQNSSVLRQEIRKGRPIRDASLNADGTLRVDKPSSFLEAERNLLRNQGWTFDPSTGFWSPPQ